MIDCTVTDTFVSVLLPGPKAPDSHTAETIVRLLLEKEHISAWDAMYIEVFPSASSILLLARPRSGTEIRIASYALPYLQDYFAE